MNTAIPELADELRGHNMRRILLVDDDAATREFFARLVRDFHCTLDLAEDGQQGLEMALADGYDLLLVDFSMPGMNGLELFRELARTRANHPPLVFLSGYVNAENTESASRIGFTAWIRKPNDFTNHHFLESMLRAFGISKRQSARLPPA